jgi:hypothetical protein
VKILKYNINMDQRRRLLLAAATEIMMKLIMIEKKRNAKKHPKKVWVRNWLNRRLQGKGILTMVNEELLLIEDPSAYKTFLRVDHYSFAKLLNKVEVALTKQDTVV